MILPVVAYGANILRQVAAEIQPDYEGLNTLLSDMWQTMYNSNGVGLAAPQVNRPVRLFVMDSVQVFDNMDEEDRVAYPGQSGIKQAFINPVVLGYSGEPWPYNEGCLSIPKVREDVMRPQSVTIEYENEMGETKTETFSGLNARIIQHEYDHLEGKLFIDYLAPLKKKLLKGKLSDISKGKVRMDYRMIYPK